MVIGVAAAVAAGLPEAVSDLPAAVLGLPAVAFEVAEALQAGGSAVVAVVAAQGAVVAVSIPARFSAASMPMATA